jgi:hypothetical protein
MAWSEATPQETTRLSMATSSSYIDDALDNVDRKLFASSSEMLKA